MLTEFSHRIESSLPGRLSELSRFLAEAEKWTQADVCLADKSSLEALVCIDDLIKKQKVTQRKAQLRNIVKFVAAYDRV